MNELLHAGQKYLSEGFSIVVNNDKKYPIKEWKEYETSQMPEKELERLLSYPNAHGIGIVTGFNNVEAIDFDLKHDVTGTLIKRFSEKVGPELIGKMKVHSTKNKGYHLIYRCEAVEGNQKLANSASGETLIETRGIGGQIAAPPTPGYSALGHYSKSIQTITPEERTILFEAARSFNEVPDVEEKRYVPPVELSDDGTLRPGDDFNIRGDEVAVLETAGWTKTKEDNERIYFRRPGNTDAEHSGNWHKELRVFKVFSTSTEFQPEHAYKLFSVYATLLHGGNHSIAAAQLRREGFGSGTTEITSKDLEIELPEKAESYHPFYKTMKENPGLIRNWMATAFGAISDFFRTQGIPEPTPLHFPFHILPKAFREYLNCQPEEIDQDQMAAAMLCAMSAAIGNSAVIKAMDEYFMHASIFALNVGEPGAAKTTAIKKAFAPIKARARQMKQEFNDAHIMWQKRRAIEKADKKEIDRSDREPVKKQMTLNDFTIEKLIKVLDVNRAGTSIVVDELNTLLQSWGKYSNGKSTDRSVLCTLWSSGDWEYDRAKETTTDIDLSEPVINLLSGVQPDVLKEYLSFNKTHDGFLERILFTVSERLFLGDFQEPNIPDSVIQGYGDLINRVLKHRDALIQSVYKLSEGADGLKVQYINRTRRIQNKTKDKAAINAIIKMREYVYRFALILQIFEDAEYRFDGINCIRMDEVSAAVFMNAIELADYFMHQWKRVRKEYYPGKVVTYKDDTLSEETVNISDPVFDALPNPFVRKNIPGDTEPAKTMWLQRRKEMFTRGKDGKYWKTNASIETNDW